MVAAPKTRSDIESQFNPEPEAQPLLKNTEGEAKENVKPEDELKQTTKADEPGNLKQEEKEETKQEQETTDEKKKDK